MTQTSAMPQHIDFIQFPQPGSPRVAVATDSSPWFSFDNLCDAIGIAEPGRAIGNLDDSEWVLVETPHQHTLLVNESGMYALIVQSGRPDAESFKQWAERWVSFVVRPEVAAEAAFWADF